MTDRIEALVEQVKALSAEERVVLLNTLQDLLTPPAAGWKSAWIRECEDRLSALDRGETKTADFDSVIADLKKKYGRG